MHFKAWLSLTEGQRLKIPSNFSDSDVPPEQTAIYRRRKSDYDYDYSNDPSHIFGSKQQPNLNPTVAMPSRLELRIGDLETRLGVLEKEVKGLASATRTNSASVTQ